MNIKQINLSDNGRNTVKKILKSSKKSLPIGEQMNMTNYYAYIYANAEKDKFNYAKLLLGN